MMAAVHVVELVPRLWYCARLLTGAIVYHCRFHLCFSCSDKSKCLRWKGFINRPVRPQLVGLHAILGRHLCNTVQVFDMKSTLLLIMLDDLLNV